MPPRINPGYRSNSNRRNEIRAALRHAGTSAPSRTSSATQTGTAGFDDYDLDILVGRIGNLYTRYGLSPPSQLRDAAKHWRGIPFNRIIAAVEKHLDDRRDLYHSGAGDRFFYLVEAAIRRAWQQEHGVASGGADGPGQPQSRQRGVRHSYSGNGMMRDAIIDDDESEADVSRPGAPQPAIDRRVERIAWEGIDGDDEGDAEG